MKTTFDLPERLVRLAKAAAAEQGRPLRDLVAEAIDAKLTADQASALAAEKAPSDWEAFKSRLVQQPDGTWFNPDGIEDEGFFDALDAIRRDRLVQQRPLDPFADFAPPKGKKRASAPRRRRAD